jgi:hypothetical protein
MYGASEFGKDRREPLPRIGIQCWHLDGAAIHQPSLPEQVIR